MNIFDYIKWRGDLSLEQDGLNPVDALILSRLAYLPFESLIKPCFGRGTTLKAASDKFFKQDKFKNILWQHDPDLLRAMAGCKRFGGMRVCAYRNLIDSDATMQFSALTFELGEKLHYISYRGTDNSVIGWQEDFNLYCASTLPSQEKALEYFGEAAKKLGGRFVLGGHSKGGNLAMYAAELCSKQLQSRIEAVYNHDGPGLNRASENSEKYDAIKNKIHTYVPQSSVFGMMFVHDEDFSIVKSNSKSFMQHDVYSWEVLGRDFVYLNERTNSSYFINNTLNDLIDSMTAEERSEFINGIFSVIDSSEDKTFNEIAANWRTNSAAMLRSFMNMDKSKRSIITGTVVKAIKSAKNNISDIAPKRKAKN